MMPSETDELHEPLFQTVGTFLKALFYGEISPKSENKYSKSEYGSVSEVFQSPKLRQQKKSENRQIFSFLFSMY
jgi:hypothetical protein